MLEDFLLILATLDASVVLALVTSFQVHLDRSVEVAALVHLQALKVPSDHLQAFCQRAETVDVDHSEAVATLLRFQAWREITLLLAFSQELEPV